MIDDLTVEAAVDRLVETAGVRSADRGDAERLDIELAGIDAAVSALLTARRLMIEKNTDAQCMMEDDDVWHVRSGSSSRRLRRALMGTAVCCKGDAHNDEPISHELVNGQSSGLHVSSSPNGIVPVAIQPMLHSGNSGVSRRMWAASAPAWC